MRWGEVRCNEVRLGEVRRRRRSACRGPTYGEPWRRPPGSHADQPRESSVLPPLE